jgi:hypothetical protein
MPKTLQHLQSSPANHANRLPAPKIPERCPYCAGTSLVRRGKRVNKFAARQLWRCNDCQRVFTPGLIQRKQYPPKIVIDALLWYYSGYSAGETLRLIARRAGRAPSPNTLWNWILEYRDLCPYTRLRPSLKRRFKPHQLVRTVKLYHRQVYSYSIHRGKIETLLGPNSEHARFSKLGEYLEDMLKNCPHELFTDQQHGARASDSKTKFDRSQVLIGEKQNRATETAAFVLSTVSNNRLRHETLQRFMLTCDSVTIAVEVPIVIRPSDFEALKARGFAIPEELAQLTTGHIDFLQVRNGAVHVLDYKPDARLNRPIEQLTLYALALSRATGLRLYDFKCAWFNEDTYCEFFPLHVVHKLPPQESRGPQHESQS